jgi:hypothetical protein
MRQAFNTAKMSCAIYRGQNQLVTTDDLLNGIVDLQEQLMIHRQAPEPKPRESLATALSAALQPMVRLVVASRLEDYRSDVYEAAHEAADTSDQCAHGFRFPYPSGQGSHAVPRSAGRCARPGSRA